MTNGKEAIELFQKRALSLNARKAFLNLNKSLEFSETSLKYKHICK